MSGPLEWRKAKRSSDQGGECVELTTNATNVTYVRDSKDQEGPRLTLSRPALAKLIHSIKGYDR
ncbi:hypothetical protein GCM10009678_46830 [Actinomadura kijaniata]|uniref:DUF397 domain-containing protein n=1 Tax=Actinomadura namibiensis TaxID=182080 RepID=A0A7W3LX46_ACTNM|nr:DUF397 domain-containing protein [Actinomadura namibiensis]MBA8955862.1 hypothetical protein [Actinomadura namibiensis]